jgi:hypothetical protein
MDEVEDWVVQRQRVVAQAALSEAEGLKAVREIYGVRHCKSVVLSAGSCVDRRGSLVGLSKC